MRRLGVANLKKRAPKTFEFIIMEIERIKSVVAATLNKHDAMKAKHNEEDMKRWQGSEKNHHLTHPDEL